MGMEKPGQGADRSAAAHLDRRALLKGMALAGLGAAGAGCAAAGAPPATAAMSPASATSATSGSRAAGASGHAASATSGSAMPGGVGGVAGAAGAALGDTPQMIFTAALIAEDLATTFYYNALAGEVLHDPALAGPGGTPTEVSGSRGNVGYLRGALSQEISHADLMRKLIGRTDAAGDPVQTFYFPDGSFDDLGIFLSTLDALENAFIGAYLAAVRELSAMAARVALFPDDPANAALPVDPAVQLDAAGNPYTAAQLAYFAEASAAILCVEAEHRALGRVIGQSIPANNLCYAQTAGIRLVYSGASSAVAALAPFVKPGAKDFTATGYALQAARRGARAWQLPCTGGLPG
jgi:hypothetical protein